MNLLWVLVHLLELIVLIMMDHYITLHYLIIVCFVSLWFHCSDANTAGDQYRKSPCVYCVLFCFFSMTNTQSRWCLLLLKRRLRWSRSMFRQCGVITIITAYKTLSPRLFGGLLLGMNRWARSVYFPVKLSDDFYLQKLNWEKSGFRVVVYNLWRSVPVWCYSTLSVKQHWSLRH